MPSQGWSAQSYPQASHQRQRHRPKRVVVQEADCESNGPERVDCLATLLPETLLHRVGQPYPLEPNCFDRPPFSLRSVCQFRSFPSLMVVVNE
jgi:hypothetical protein